MHQPHPTLLLVFSPCIIIITTDTAIRRVTVGHVTVCSQNVFKYKEGESLRTLWDSM